MITRIASKLKKILKNLTSKKPKHIPAKFFNAFSLNGRVRITYSFRDDEYPNTKPIIFDKESIDKMIIEARTGQVKYYGATDKYLSEAFLKYNDKIKNKEGIDMGSVTGWYSAFTLAYGAAKSYVLEYNKIISKHEKIIPMQYKDFENFPRKFDFATSISSFEHDGLGRYGDPIDPDSDLKAMEKMKSIIKTNGLLFLAVPIGKDRVVWNLHRIYGRARFKKLIDGWKLIDAFGFNETKLDQDLGDSIYKKSTPYQPVFVLKNIPDKKRGKFNNLYK